MEKSEIFYDNLEYLGYLYLYIFILPFGTFCVELVHFSGFGIMHQEKSGNPAPAVTRRQS
jgi:hypothetical protein